jgi:hypothetical protein
MTAVAGLARGVAAIERDPAVARRVGLFGLLSSLPTASAEAYGSIMDAEEERAAAVAGRERWRREGRAAIYDPGTAVTVRVLPVVGATRRGRFAAVIVRDGRAEHSLPCDTAVHAVGWAEHIRLS